MKKRSLPIGRRILTIVVAFIMCALVVFAVFVLSLNAMFQKSTINRTFANADLSALYGEDTVKAVNVGIMHLTNSAYTESLYLTKDTLGQYINDKQVKVFLVNQIAEFAKAATKGTRVSVSVDEMVPLFSGVRDHIQKEVGITVSAQDIANELSAAFGGTELVWETRLVLLHSGWAIVAILITVFLALLEYALSYPSTVNGSIVCIGAFITAFIILLCTSFSVNVLEYETIQKVLGENIVNKWLSLFPGILRKNAFFVLIGAVTSLIIMILKIMDERRVQSIAS